MPEIKHQFTGGKMNKDLDERLVPNGEYRDAMNIQVATSEGSDVGTAQNILGNLGIPSPEISIKNAITGATSGYTFLLPDNAVCVGAISDEKNDVMYYLVWTLEADYIFEWDGNLATDLVFVFVDKNKSILKFTNDMTITGINIIDGMLFWTDNINEPRKINIQRCIDGTNGNPSVQTKLVNGATGVKTNMEEKHITVIKKGPQVAPDMKLHTFRQPNKIYTALFDISSSTDLDGSDNDFTYKSATTAPSGMFDLSNITTSEGSNIFYVRIYEALDSLGNEIFLANSSVDGGPLDGMTGWYEEGASTSTIKGTKVVIQAYDEDGEAPGLPLTDFVIKGEIISVSPYSSSNPDVLIGTTASANPEPNNPFENYYSIGIQVTTVDGFPAQAELGETLRYAIDLFDETEKLFEFKFPRFSYRYKFEDGEYSTFAPFTQVAFTPGSFDYHPRKGYNIGMTNKLQRVDLLNIITPETPDDVVAIDILFKDDASPSIYIVDTIRPDDYTKDPLTQPNLWNQMKSSSVDVNTETVPFAIKREAISSIIPSNQLLRPWDNVPKKALAQDVTGNRVVYANYFQNYNLLSEFNKKYVPSFTVTTSDYIVPIQSVLDPSSNISTNAFKSIKSLREYQLGVVFLDKHGRETPVLSNHSGTHVVNKIDADQANRFGVEFNSDDYPELLTHFKFYVKETSTEYYNMAMDRWYSAGDGNIWLAFPSSDRNKIDIDTFLILKKGSDQDTLVVEPARYKVLAIESEAPDFIKTSKRLAFQGSHSTGGSVLQDIFGSSSFDIPIIGETKFKMNYKAFHGTSGQDLALTEDELYIEFASSSSDEVSKRYKINSLTNSWVDTKTDIEDEDVFTVELDEPLGSDVNFISNDINGISPTLIETGAIVRVYRYKVENGPQFDGRFFVKIYFDEVFRNNIEITEIGGGLRTSSFKKVYSMKNDLVETHSSGIMKRFLTNSIGQSRESWIQDSNSSDPEIAWRPQWLNQGGGAVGTIEGNKTWNGDVTRYGYYGVDEFAANALYFRRYRTKTYTKNGASSIDQDYGVEQKGIPYRPSGDFNTQFNQLVDRGDKALVHLSSNGTSAVTNFDGTPSVSYRGLEWKDTNSWEMEFGYHQKKHSMHQRELGALGDDPGDNQGVTSMWSKYKRTHAGYVWKTIVPQHSQSWVEGYASDERAARDTEVWFIDAGPYMGSYWQTDGKLKFNGQNTLASGSNNDFDSIEGNYRTGLKGANNANGWQMELGFGGIKKSNWNGYDEVNNLWNVGDWNQSAGQDPNGNYSDIGDFVNRLNIGYKFRWREDVDQTRLYTISGNVADKDVFRHSDGPHFAQPGNPGHHPNNHGSGCRERKWDVPWEEKDGNMQPGDDDFMESAAQGHLRTMAPGLSFNLSKSWQIPIITPALGWNPTADGIIPNGLTMELTCVRSDGFIGTTSPTATHAEAFNCSGINAQDLTIFVKSTIIEGSGDSLSTSLHEGMALTSYVNDADASVTPPNLLVVREITIKNADQANECFALKLGGYKVPLLAADHTFLNINSASTKPGAGKIMTFKQVGMNGFSPNSEFNINTISRYWGGNDYGAIAAVGYTLEFVEEIQPVEVLSENPAIWETEPKESTDLDVYYEGCGSIPTQINDTTIASAFPIGTKFKVNGFNYSIIGYDGEKVKAAGAGVTIPPPITLNSIPVIDPAIFFRPDDLAIKIDITSVDVLPNNEFLVGFEAGMMSNSFVLPWHNCYTFKNGVESNRIRDNFNLPYISNGVKASATLEQGYEEEHRKYGLIYSGIYNSTSGINNLNQFIAAEKITKDINPIYGSIQKLYSRDSDLVTLCEDKILKITANKDALFNADGNPQLIATDRVLGQTIPFSGKYGISTNPESFASESFRAYFTDKVRGAVMRLSKDGLTPISDAGMKDWFRDNLKNSKRLLGSYDDRNSEYNLALNFEDRTSTFDGEGYVNRENNKVLTFSEKVVGWVSFKSFTDMQYGISLANDYYTLKNGALFLHNTNPIRNTFYGVFNPSTLDVVLNDDPGSVKVFNTLNYEGSQARVDKFTSKEIDGTTYNDQEYYNLYEKKGWSVESIITNKEEGKVNEFIEKEGKWFNGINKIVDISAKAETSDFTFQGIGVTSGAAIDDDYGITVKPKPAAVVDDVIDDNDDNDKPQVFGCTNPTANNYNPLATNDDGSCAFDIAGCTNPKATNYNPLAVVDDGSCIIPDKSDDRIFGCTNPIALNYNSLANVDDGSCILPPPKTTTTKGTATKTSSTRGNY